MILRFFLFRYFGFCKCLPPRCGLGRAVQGAFRVTEGGTGARTQPARTAPSPTDSSVVKIMKMPIGGVAATLLDFRVRVLFRVAASALRRARPGASSHTELTAGEHRKEPECPKVCREVYSTSTAPSERGTQPPGSTREKKWVSL